MAGRFELSFPGRRGTDDPWFRIGTFDVGTAALVAGLAAISMFVWALSPDLLEPLVLWPDDVRSGQVWRIATWPLANAPDIWTLVTIALLWYFGRELERVIGRNKFALLLLLLAVVPGLVGTLVDIPQAGIRSVEIAVFALFAAEYPHIRFFFGIPAWVIAAAIIVIEILQLTGMRDSDRILLLFVSLLTAAVAGRSFGLLGDYPFIPKLAGGGGGRRTRRRGRGRGRDFDRVVAGPWNPPTHADQAEMDRLLDKMNTVGLSDAERRRLSELGKRLRGG